MPKKIFLVYAVTALGICLWLSLIFLAPYLESESSPFSRWIYLMFAPTCHQNASRCFHLWGYPLAVCARCLGIYFGFLGGTLFYPGIRGFKSLTIPRLKVLLWISLPIAIDTLSNVLTLWSSPAWLRLILGALWGSILPFYFIPGIADALVKTKKAK
ncbi:MAG: DUF2085 domain-containing protein [Candidatus Aminicenantes bacterium]|nr:DUF2085 domain-containing protein [Candidatus Aminicenantes bacterium]